MGWGWMDGAGTNSVMRAIEHRRYGATFDYAD